MSALVVRIYESPESLEVHTSQKRGSSLCTVTVFGRDAGAQQFLALFIKISRPISDVMEDRAKRWFFFHCQSSCSCPIAYSSQRGFWSWKTPRSWLGAVSLCSPLITSFPAPKGLAPSNCIFCSLWPFELDGNHLTKCTLPKCTFQCWDSGL